MITIYFGILVALGKYLPIIISVIFFFASKFTFPTMCLKLFLWHNCLDCEMYLIYFNIV